jgi:hypothetical protein
MEKKAVDLAVAAGQKRRSPRTGFIHLSYTEKEASDTIPLFENFCFAFALFRKKCVESMLEARELLEKLLAFQSPEGNFPIYLHDYPRCYDPHQALKIAAVLVQIERHFGQVIPAELKAKMAAALPRLMEFSEKRTRPPLWEHRFARLKGLEFPFTPTTQEEWFHWMVSEQLVSSHLSQEIPYESSLHAFLGGEEIQERGEPSLSPFAWALTEEFSERLLRDHPAMIPSALLFPVEMPKKAAPPYVLIPEGVRLLWQGKKLHSLSAPGGKLERDKIYFPLKESPNIEKGDLIEAALYTDISAETEVTINGKRGTVFQLEDRVEIATPTLTIGLRFELLEGEGQFCGQISFANRPSQTARTGYEAFDWQIALRTLRREPNCLIALSFRVRQNEEEICS